MYPFIVCYSCGKPIGDLYDLYTEQKLEMMREKYSVEKLTVDFAMLSVSDTVDANTGKILNDMNLNTHCCRVHMMSQVMFYDIY